MIFNFHIRKTLELEEDISSTFMHLLLANVLDIYLSHCTGKLLFYHFKNTFLKVLWNIKSFGLFKIKPLVQKSSCFSPVL